MSQVEKSVILHPRSADEELLKKADAVRGENGDIYVLKNSAKPLKAFLQERVAEIPHRTVKEAHEYVELVDLWLEKAEEYRKEVTHTSFILLMSDFLFSRLALPSKWLVWATRLRMIQVNSDLELARDKDLQMGELAEYQIIVIRMLFIAHRKLKELGHQRYHLIGLLEFINQVESFTVGCLTKAINVAKGQEQIKYISDSLADVHLLYPSNEKSDKAIEMPLRDFADSWERKVLTALLVGKAFSDTIIRNLKGIDVLQEKNKLFLESEDALECRTVGNTQFQAKNYDKALEKYSKAIQLSKFSAALYSNRCQTALKLKQYRLAVSDGYRATALKPNWGKAYYRHAEALKGNNQLDVAIEVNELGLELCDDANEKLELTNQKRRFGELKNTIPNPSPEESVATNASAVPPKKAKKSKKNKKKSTRIPIVEQAPMLISDDDTMKDVSDSELNVNTYIPMTAVKIMPMSKKPESQVGKDEKNKPITEEGDDVIKQNDDKSVTESTGRDKKKKNSKKNETSKEKKSQKKSKEKQIKEDAEGEDPPQEETLRSKYLHFLEHGSGYYLLKHYDHAMRNFDMAIEVMDHAPLNHQWKVIPSEQFSIVYTRGMASMKLSEPAAALDFFGRLTDLFRVKEVHHPLAYYGLTIAHNQLNNFSMMIKPVQLGMKMLEKRSNIGALNWPGLSREIPESKPDALRILFQDMEKVISCPPKPDAVCFYRKCGKDDKNQPFVYSLSEKDIFRKEIYFTDLNYKGFLNIFCTWSCRISFHLDCWSKYRTNVFKKPRDKEVLDMNCFTDGCKGTICKIIRFDERNEKEKDIKTDKEIEKWKPKKMGAFQMLKSERNHERRQRRVIEAKRKKKIYEKERIKANIQDSSNKKNEEKISVKTPKVASDADLAMATILKKDENELQNLKPTKTKMKNKLKKKTHNMISLREFLGNFRNGLTLHEVEEAISNRPSNEPFQIPDDFRDEIETSEDELTNKSAEEVLRITIIYQYYETFFEQNGPVLVDDDLFLQQQLLFPPEMSLIISKTGITSFLRKTKNRFLLLPPYIGLASQESRMKHLCQEYVKDIKARANSSDNTQQEVQRSTSLDTLDVNFESLNGLSDFARDLYRVGEVPVEDVQTIMNETENWNEVGGKKTSKVFEQPREKKNRDVLLLKISDDAEENTSRADLPLNKVVETTEERVMREMDAFLAEGNDDVHQVDDNKSGSQTSAMTSSDKICLQGELHDSSSCSTETTDNTDDDVDVMTTGTQTQLIPSYKEELEKLETEKQLLEERLENLNDKYTRLSVSSRTESTACHKELKEAKELLVSTRKKALNATQHAESELKKMTKDRAVWNESMKTIKSKLQVSQDGAAELQRKLTEKEDRFTHLSRVLQEQKDIWLEEKKLAEEKKEKMTEMIEAGRERAIEAEIKTLRTEENFGLKILMKAKGECERITVEFEKLSRVHAKNPSAQREVLNGFLKWKSNIETCGRLIAQTKKQFGDHVDKIRQGTMLSELTPIHVPSPPSPGPNIQQVAMAAMRVPNLGGPPVPMNSFSLNGTRSPSPPSLNGVESQPSTSLPRTPQPPIGTGKQSTISARNNHTPSIESAAASQPKGSFEKIMLQLQELFPNVTRTELALCIKEVRQNNNNSLTGLSLEDIVHQASQIVYRSLARKPMAPVSHGTSAPSVLTSVTSATVAPWHQSRSIRSPNLMSVSDDEPCVICHDPLTSMEVHKLLCGHVFHNECLTKWLERNRTCPTCRDYAVDPSEYPALCNVARR